MPRLRKRPSTSELIDWIAVLMQAGVGRERLVRELPFLGVLLKKEQDVELLKAMRHPAAPTLSPAGSLSMARAVHASSSPETERRRRLKVAALDVPTSSAPSARSRPE